MPYNPPPRRYQLRVFDGAYEVLHQRRYEDALDLDSPGVGNTLDRWLRQLTREATAANEPMDHPRLEIWDVETGVKVRDWSGA
jgi:hypothetical protein